MADPSLTNVLRYIRRLIRTAPSADCSDAQLLQQFVSRRDEAAFTALVGRHGPLVLGVCRNVLGDIHAAEDAFQATFLVLARQAASIRQPQALAPWLHRVAYRIALTARADAARRHTRERQTQTMAQAASTDPGSNDWQAILHEEVNQLPDKYRVPVVLCYFEGKTHQQAASQLEWPLGTLKGRLARARDMLRTRLARRGVVLTVATLTGVQLGDAVAGSLSAGLLDATVKAALRGAASAPVAALAKAALRTLMLTRLKLAAFVLLGLATAVLGAGAVLNRARPDRPFAQEGTLQDEAGPKVAQGRTDADGDPLPAGARLRLGSARFRHGDRIIAMAYSADGRTLVTAGLRGLIRTWDAKTGRPRATFRQTELTYAGLTIALSPDGKLLATAGLIDDSKKPLPPRKVILARLSKDVALQTLEVPGGNVHSVAFSRNGKHLAVASDDWVTFWDCATGREIRRFQVAGRGAQAEVLALSPDGELLVAKVAPPRQPIRLWDVATGKERPPLAGEAAAYTSFAFSSDGRMLASCYGTEVSLWDPYTGKPMGKLISQDKPSRDGEIEGVNHVAFSSDGKLVATTGNQGTVRLWDATSGKVRAVLQSRTGPGERPWALAFAPDDKTLAVGGDLEEITHWDVATGQRIQLTKEPIMGPCYAAIAPDGTVLATVSERRHAQLWDARTGERIGEPIDITGSWTAFSPDGSSLVIGSTLWNLATREFVTLRSGDQFATISPDQQFVAQSPLLAMWRAATRKMLWCDIRLNVSRPSFSIDGKTVVCGCEVPGKGHIVTLRETVTGKEIGYLPCPDRCWTVALCPDGQTIATAGEHYIQLWDLASRRMVRQLEQAPKDPGRLGWTQRRPLVFSPDGRILAAAGVNNTIRLWDIATGEELPRLSGHGAQVISLAFASDGRTLVSGSADTTVLVWDLASPIELVHRASRNEVDKRAGYETGLADR